MTITIDKVLLDRTIDIIADLIDDTGGCDHSVGICACREKSVLHSLKLARGDEDAAAFEKLCTEAESHHGD